MAVNWSYFDKFEKITANYMPDYGEGDTIASQAVTAVNKLVYKWYNDGDVFDNTKYLEGWCNDLSSYANWLAKYTPAGTILNRVYECYTGDDYEELLQDLADMILDSDWLEEWKDVPKAESIYNCGGDFKFVEYGFDDEEEY